MDQTFQEILDLREKLTRELDEFKKVDFPALTKSAIHYRQQLLALHEAGTKLSSEMQKVGEKVPNNLYAAEFIRRGFDQEHIEKDRFQMQTKFWDGFILPLMNAEQADKKDFEGVERKLKGVSSQIDNQAKKEKKKGKKGSADVIQQALLSMKTKQADLLNYFQGYQEIRFHKALKACCAAIDAERIHYENCSATLNKETWKAVLAVEPKPLPDISSRASMEPPVSNHSNLNSSTQITQPSALGRSMNAVPEPTAVSINNFATSISSAFINALKIGYMVKRGDKMKSWKKRWFVLTHDKLQYYKNQTSGESGEAALGELNFFVCSDLQLADPKELKRFLCFSITTPGRIWYFSCDSREDLESWMDAIKSRIPSKSTSEFALENSYLPAKVVSDEDGVPPESAPQEETTSEWMTLLTPEGIEYFYNQKSGVTQWEKPQELM